MIRFAGSITDIDDRKQKDDEIENLAYYDQLTSLPNRTLTMELARKALQTTKAGTRCGLMFIDIDNFKYVNDTFGHSVGDKVLVQIAGILSSLVNENISISRFGGDEFVMLVNNTNTEAMERFAQLVLRLTGRKLEIDGRYHFLTISAGIALSPGEESGLAELFQKADAALHRAKLAGKTRYQLYDDSIGDELVNRMEMESGLRTAIENGELYVAYQPLINVTTGRIEGMEALARWNNPGKGHQAGRVHPDRRILRPDRPDRPVRPQVGGPLHYPRGFARLPGVHGLGEPFRQAAAGLLFRPENHPPHAGRKRRHRPHFPRDH